MSLKEQIIFKRIQGCHNNFRNLEILTSFLHIYFVVIFNEIPVKVTTKSFHCFRFKRRKGETMVINYIVIQSFSHSNLIEGLFKI